MGALKWLASLNPYKAFLIFESSAIVPRELLPYKRLMGMCRWMGSHFHDWIDYNGVAFSIELLAKMWSHIFGFFSIFTVSKLYQNVCTAGKK